MTEVHSLSRLRERAGERVSPQWDNPQAEKALSRGSFDFSRVRKCFLAEKIFGAIPVSRCSGTPENVGPALKGDVLLCKLEGLPDMSIKIV